MCGCSPGAACTDHGAAGRFYSCAKKKHSRTTGYCLLEDFFYRARAASEGRRETILTCCLTLSDLRRPSRTLAHMRYTHSYPLGWQGDKAKHSYTAREFATPHAPNLILQFTSYNLIRLGPISDRATALQRGSVSALCRPYISVRRRAACPEGCCIACIVYSDV